MIATILEEGIKGKNSYFQFTVIILQGEKNAIKPLINDSLQWQNLSALQEAEQQISSNLLYAIKSYIIIQVLGFEKVFTKYTLAVFLSYNQMSAKIKKEIYIQVETTTIINTERNF